jgi:hypothetical protein
MDHHLTDPSVGKDDVRFSFVGTNINPNECQSAIKLGAVEMQMTAKPNGLLYRPGHAEAALEYSRLSEKGERSARLDLEHGQLRSTADVHTDDPNVAAIDGGALNSEMRADVREG